MKFKRNGLYLEAMVGTIVLLFACLTFLIVGYHAGKDLILLFLGLALFVFVIYTTGIRGLFYDTVYCDEKGIKLVTRKKTTEISWNEVYKVEGISGRGGVAGWAIMAVNGEEISILPVDLVVKKRFKNYMQSKLPHLDIR